MVATEVPTGAETEAPKKAKGIAKRPAKKPAKKIEEAAAEGSKATEASQSGTLTSEEFTERLDQLAARARASGLNPVREMFSTYGRRIMAGFEGFLEGLDGSKKKDD